MPDLPVYPATDFPTAGQLQPGDLGHTWCTTNGMDATYISAIIVTIGLSTLSANGFAQTAEKSEASSPTSAQPTGASAGQVSDQGWTGATDQGTVAASPSPTPASPAPALPPATNSQGSTPAPASTPLTSPPSSDSTESAPSDEPVTLFGQKKSVKFGGYGAFGARYARIAGDDGTMLGGEGAFLIDHRLAIGLAGYGWANDKQLPASQRFAHPHMHFGYGGFLLRYHVFVPQTPVSISVATLVGGGAVGLTEWWDDEVRRENADMFFIFEPQLGAHLNVTRWMRLGVDAGYRFISGIGKFGFTEADFRGASVGASVGFGWF